MSKMPKKKSEQLLYPVGVSDLLFCMMVSSEAVLSGPSYEMKIWRLPVAVKLGVKGNGTVKTKYASNKMFARVGRQTEHELSLDHVAIPIELWDKMNGVQAREGVTFATNEVKEMPFFAFGYVGPLSDGSTGATWYPRVQLSNAEEVEFETTTDEIDIKDLKLTMTASALLLNGVIYSQFNPARDGIKHLTFDDYISEVVYDEKILEKLIGMTLISKVKNVQAGNIQKDSIDLTWEDTPNAKSYVIRYGVDGQPNDRLHYSEAPNFTLTDAIFTGTLAGQKLNFYIQAFEKTYPGKDEITKANNAMADNVDIWSDVCTVDFPTTI
ncbi:hypothetical protein D7094_14005 [Listeria monocytogenes]|nr:hypothetical protein [Listeria monocytogenes]EAE0845966.1 hypothetical protein [Listeria monocytogenes]EAF8771731.1 hypothetical protein [Listeria monocytogenes]EEA6131060.1 hypothetical protein [Listeria monocytogenes]MML69669.1 hypothetical protein [Listeria monocytogenes]